MYIYKSEKWEPMEDSPQEVGLKPRIEDREGNVWFSGNGVKVWNPTTKIWTSYNTANSPLTTDNTTDIIDDSNGNIIVAADCYFATDARLTRGIFVKRGNAWTKYDTVNTGMPSVDVLCLARDSTGNIWFGSRLGVLKWDGNSKWEYMCKGAANIHQPFGFIRALTVDAKNRVWVAAFHIGFFLYDQNGPGCTPKIKITHPVMGTVTKQKTLLLIEWEYEGPVGAIKIEIRQGNKSWTNVVDKLNNNRKYNWYTDTLSTSSIYQIRVSASDNPAVFDTSDRFTIADSGVNIPPEIYSLPDTFEVKTNQKTTLTVHARDVDKDSLKFNCANLPLWVSFKDSVVTFEPQTGSQSFTLKVSVSDGKGGVTQDSVFVVVSVITSNSKSDNFISSHYKLQKDKSGMIVLSSEKSGVTIHASLFDLCGKKVGDFTQVNDQYVINNKHIQFPNTVYILVIRSRSEHGNLPYIEKLLIR
jgi:hypothetical protein